MPPDMYRKTGGVFKCHSANRTQVGLLVQLFSGLFSTFKLVMLFHMDCQWTRLSERCLTYDAGVWLVSCMCRHMSFHVRSSETIPVIPFRGTKKKFGALFRSMTDWFCSFYYNFINNNNRMKTCCKFFIKKLFKEILYYLVNCLLHTLHFNFSVSEWIFICLNNVYLERNTLVHSEQLNSGLASVEFWLSQ